MAFQFPPERAASLTDEQWKSAYEILDQALSRPRPEWPDVVRRATSDAAIAQLVMMLLEEEHVSETHQEENGSREGTVVGRYRVLTRLGRGGMGEVYSARDTELGRMVALKFVAPDLAANGAAADRLFREAKAASALNHPHIITVHEVIRQGEQVALAMELVEGRNLRGWCRDPQPVNVIADWGRQIAQALAAAHAQGIIHRDIKPENLMVRTDGYVKVLDFGLARQNIQEALSSANLSTIFGGTLHYMSPEQTRGERLTGATDTFSLGIVLYELAAGKHPFTGDSAIDTAYAIAHKTPKPPSTHNPHVPGKLDALILAMLAKDPQNRPTASEIDRALGAIGSSKPSAKRIGWIAAGAAVVILSAAGYAYFRRPETPAKTPETTLFWITRLTGENNVTAAAESVDGGTIAYGPLDGTIQIKRLTGGAVRPVAGLHVARAERLVWFADDARLLLTGKAGPSSRAGVWVVPIDNGAAATLIAPDGEEAMPSPDGSRVAFTSFDSSNLWVAGSDGKASRLVMAGGGASSFSALSWSPDGKRIGFQRKEQRAVDRRDPSAAVLPEWTFAYSYEWLDIQTRQIVDKVKDIRVRSAFGLPDGRVYVLRCTSPESPFESDIWEIPVHPSTGRVLGPARQLTNLRNYYSSLTAGKRGGSATLVVSTDVRNIFVADLKISDPPQFTGVRRLTFAQTDEFPHAWKPGGKEIIFESLRNGESFNLFGQPSDGGEAQPLVKSPRSDVLAQTTADGKWILYREESSQKPARLMRIAARGGAPEPIPLEGKVDEFRCPLRSGSCVMRSPENDQFVFNELDPIRGKGREVGRTAWYAANVADWDVSPDGQMVAIPNHDPHNASIRLVPLNHDVAGADEKIVRLPGLKDIYGLFSAADGKGWFVSVSTAAGGVLYYADITGKTHQLRQSPRPIYAVPSPDGKHVAFPDVVAPNNVYLIGMK